MPTDNFEDSGATDIAGEGRREIMGLIHNSSAIFSTQATSTMTTLRIHLCRNAIPGSPIRHGTQKPHFEPLFTRKSLQIKHLTSRIDTPHPRPNCAKMCQGVPLKSQPTTSGVRCH
jgi:hypothetical protein